MPTPAGYVETAVPTTGLSDPFGIAVDGSGNLYIADPNNLRIVKETLSQGTWVQSTIPATGLTDDAQWVAVDANGNVYISDFGSKQVLRETPSSTGYTQSTIPATRLSAPAGVAIDASGNVYIADTGNNQIVKEDFADPPALSFAATSYGAVSSDSPQIVTLENIGNNPLAFPVLSGGSNPSISQGFVLDSSASSACPVISTGSSTPGTLASNAACNLAVSFEPAATGDITGSLVLTGNALNASSPGDATQTIQLSGTGLQATPTMFTLTGTSVTIAPGATTGNTSTITVTPSGGFTGNVNLVCAVTTTIATPTDAPACFVRSFMKIYWNQ